MPFPVEVSARGALPFPAVAGQALELVRKAHAARQSSRGMAGVPTGLPKLDEYLGGLQTGLHIIGAEPGAGKTALALTIARHAAVQHRLPVVYASFDEVPERLALKILAARTGLTAADLMGGRVPMDTVEQALDEHARELASLCFVPADARLSAADLIEQLRDRIAHHETDTGLLVIDYLQPWAAAQASQGMDYRLAVGALALALRGMANTTGCPVLLVSAQNRGGQGSASMTSLRESSDLEYGADSILMLTDDKEALVGSGKFGRLLTLAKNRFGPASAEIPLVLDGRTQIVTERK